MKQLKNGGPGPGMCSGYSDWGENPGEGEIFRTRPDLRWGPPSQVYSGRAVDHPPPSSAEVKEKVELYLYSPFESSWPVIG